MSLKRIEKTLSEISSKIVSSSTLKSSAVYKIDKYSKIISALNTEYMSSLEGKGKLFWVAWTIVENSAKTEIVPRLLIDGKDIIPFSLNDGPLSNWQAAYVTSSSQGFQIGFWDDVSEVHTAIVCLSLKFNSELKIGVSNIDPVNPHPVQIHYLAQYQR